MEEKKRFLQKGNRRSGLVFISLILLLIFSSIALPFSLNPFYLLMSLTSILLFGDLFNIFFLFFILFYIMYYFFDVRFEFLNSKRIFGIILFFLLFGLLILSIIAIDLTNKIIGFTKIIDFYKLTFWTPWYNSTISFLTSLNSGSWYVGVNLNQFGIFLPFIIWMFGGWGFQLFAPIFFLILIFYSIYIITYSEFVFIFEKLKFWQKPNKNVKITKKLSSVDLNEETKEFEINIDPVDKEKNKILNKVRSNKDTSSYEKLQKKMSTEKARLDKLKNKIIDKLQNEKNKKALINSTNKIHNIEELLGESSYSKIKKKIEENQIAKVQEQKQKVELELQKQKEDLSSSFIKDDFIPEIEKKINETNEIPLIQEYYDEIFQNSQSLSDSISQTLEEIIEIPEQKQIIEVVLDSVKKEETIEQHIKISEKYENKMFFDGIKENNLYIEKENNNEQKNIYNFQSKNFEKIESNEWCKNYIIPSTKILNNQNEELFNNQALSDDALEKSEKLNSFFESFKIDANVKSFEIGPIITTFKIESKLNIELINIKDIEDKIKLNLKIENIKIVNQIPETSLFVIEIPNIIKKPILFKNIFEKMEKKSKNELMIPIGIDYFGKLIPFNLSKSEHLLIVGSLNSDKLNTLNIILVSLLLRYKPKDLQLIIIDNKINELKLFYEIPHLISKIINDNMGVNLLLREIINEIEIRYKKMYEFGVQKIEDLNERLLLNDENEISYIVIFINKIEDFIINNNEIEKSIMMIIQKAKVVGINIIISTQNASLEIVSKINKLISSKIVFALPSSIESRIILGQSGAEKLIGMGDMLFSLYEKSAIRGQIAYITNEEINELIKYIKNQCSPIYKIKIDNLNDFKNENVTNDNLTNIHDPIYVAAKNIINYYGRISISMLQNQLNIGYNKAVDIMKKLNQEGIIDSNGELINDSI